MKLECRDLNVTFAGSMPGNAPALDRVALAVASGELVAITGPNGSGKTTLLRALLGLINPESGSVTLDARPVASWPRRTFAGVVAALPQREEPAFPLTVREVLLMGRWARLGPLTAVGADDEQAMRDALVRCDVAGFDQRTVDTLSGGEWQRVRLARALVSQPQLLLLDEPTTALDIGHEMEIFELLRGLANEGLGVLMITHHLNLAARFADRIILLDRGQVAADGPPSAVLSTGLIERVFAWPVAIVPWHDGAPQVVPLRTGETGP